MSLLKIREQSLANTITDSNKEDFNIAWNEYLIAFKTLSTENQGNPLNFQFQDYADIGMLTFACKPMAGHPRAGGIVFCSPVNRF